MKTLARAIIAAKCAARGAGHPVNVVWDAENRYKVIAVTSAADLEGVHRVAGPYFPPRFDWVEALRDGDTVRLFHIATDGSGEPFALDEWRFDSEEALRAFFGSTSAPPALFVCGAHLVPLVELDVPAALIAAL